MFNFMTRYDFETKAVMNYVESVWFFISIFVINRFPVYFLCPACFSRSRAFFLIISKPLRLMDFVYRKSFSRMVLFIEHQTIDAQAKLRVSLMLNVRTVLFDWAVPRYIQEILYYTVPWTQINPFKQTKVAHWTS